MSEQIAIVGYGIEGQSAYRYCRNVYKDAHITIFDEQQPQNAPADVNVIVGRIDDADLHGFATVFRSPSVRPDRIHANGRLTSVTKEFLKIVGPQRVIGVTGSKGKGTTTSLIYEILKNAGLSVKKAGNIGVPALDLLPVAKDEWVVLELSSFQLWDLDVGPHIAVLLMIEPEHLDVHTSVDEYITAKGNITAHQKPDDVLVYLPTNQLTAQAIHTQAQKIPYTQAPGAHVENDVIVIDGQRIIPTSELGLVGQHNVENACAAVTAAWRVTQDVDAIWKALASFNGLPHRLQLAREVNGVSYYDDSIATTPGSAIAALKAFEQPKVIILGGSDKGADFAELAQEIKASNMRSVILIGAMQDKIHNALRGVGFDESRVHSLGRAAMTDIVSRAARDARPGDAVIMSPACASFDMFKNYRDRGEQFIVAVESLS